MRVSRANIPFNIRNKNTLTRLHACGNRHRTKLIPSIHSTSGPNDTPQCKRSEELITERSPKLRIPSQFVPPCGSTRLPRFFHAVQMGKQFQV